MLSFYSYDYNHKKYTCLKCVAAFYPAVLGSHSLCVGEEVSRVTFWAFVGVYPPSTSYLYRIYNLDKTYLIQQKNSDKLHFHLKKSDGPFRCDCIKTNINVIICNLLQYGNHEVVFENVRSGMGIFILCLGLVC